VRLDDRWRLGDPGAVYEFNIKLLPVKAEAPQSAWDNDVQMAMQEFGASLRKKYPWIGEVSVTGRSGGWLAIEDPKGKMTKATLDAIAKRVDAAKRQFVKDTEAERVWWAFPNAATPVRLIQPTSIDFARSPMTYWSSAADLGDRRPFPSTSFAAAKGALRRG